MNDIEARLRRLEQQMQQAALQLQVTIPQGVNQASQTLQTLAATGASYFAGDTGVYTDPVCGVSLPDTLTLNLTWGLLNEFTASISLTWDSGSGTWTGCSTLEWPGIVGLYPVGGAQGGAGYQPSLACETPVWFTLTPPNSATGSGWTLGVSFYESSATITVNDHEVELPSVPVEGSCADTATDAVAAAPLALTSCDPWTAALSQALSCYFQQVILNEGQQGEVDVVPSWTFIGNVQVPSS